MDSQMQLSNAFQLGYAPFPTISQFPTYRISFLDTSNISFDMDEMTPEAARPQRTSRGVAAKRFADMSPQEQRLLAKNAETDADDAATAAEHVVSLLHSIGCLVLPVVCTRDWHVHPTMQFERCGACGVCACTPVLCAVCFCV
jgi:hypothetical protein